MLRIFAAVFAAFLLSALPSWGTSQARKISVSALVATKRNIQEEDRKMTEKITALVHLAQPRKGAAYAKKVASSIVKTARWFHMDPYFIAATGYCESEFSMSSRPYIGIMQVSRTLARDYARRGYRYDIDSIDGNIRLGTHVLASHARSRRGELPSRGAVTSRSRLSYAVGRYNGSGSRSGYTSRVMRVYSVLRNGTPAQWQQKMRQGKMLWR